MLCGFQETFGWWKPIRNQEYEGKMALFPLYDVWGQEALFPLYDVWGQDGFISLVWWCLRARWLYFPWWCLLTSHLGPLFLRQRYFLNNCSIACSIEEVNVFPSIWSSMSQQPDWVKSRVIIDFLLIVMSPSILSIIFCPHFLIEVLTQGQVLDKTRWSSADFNRLESMHSMIFSDNFSPF